MYEMNNEEDTAPVGEVLQTAPDETQLAILTMLMRLYDVQLAVLNEMNPGRADEIYAAHSAGETFNPKLFIPVFEREE